MPKRKRTPRSPASARPARTCRYIAAIMNDMHRAAGRTGVGAVMGSKNLKAIVVRGTGAVTVADKEGLPRRRHPHQQDAQGKSWSWRQLSDLRHRRHHQPMNAVGAAADGQFPANTFRHGRRVSGEIADSHPVAADQELLPLHHFLRPRDQGQQPEIQGRGRRSRIRDRLGLRSRLRRRRSRCGDKGQLHLQRDGPRHNFDGQHHRLRHGAVPARHHRPEGNRRPATGIRQCRGDGRGGAPDRTRRRLRQEAPARFVSIGRTSTATPNCR